MKYIFNSTCTNIGMVVFLNKTALDTFISKLENGVTFTITPTPIGKPAPEYLLGIQGNQSGK